MSKKKIPQTLQELIQAAKDQLPIDKWDYLMGGSETETTLKRNRQGLDRLAFKPRVLTEVRSLDLSTQLLDQSCRLPVVLPPIGSVQMFDSGGGAAVAKAAAEFGVPQILSSVCEPDFETVAQEVGGEKIYQLYLMGDEAWMDERIQRAIDSGYSGFCLTVDTQVYSRRERDILKGFVPPSGSTIGNRSFEQDVMTWETVAHIKSKFDIPLFIKGINVAEDAERAVEAGVDVVYVSNHGGRQLDHGRACIDALPEVVAAVAGRAPVWVDGGFMRGSDVVKGLCLGASAVGVGRLHALALAAGGVQGIVRALEILEHEIRTCVQLLGVSKLQDLNPEYLVADESVSRPGSLSAFPLLDE